jgi:hypothetical protein
LRSFDYNFKLQAGAVARDGGVQCDEEELMRIRLNAFLVICCVGIAGVLSSTGAPAQTVTGSPSIALKSGESVEIGNVYYTINCRSLLVGTPEVEVFDGPPGVTATIKEGMVLPRSGNCANRVKGGTLMISAKEIEDPSYSALTVRVTFKTKDGVRKISQVYNVSLLP